MASPAHHGPHEDIECEGIDVIKCVKFQVASAKFQISTNVRNTNLRNEKVLNFDIGIWDLFGIWNL